MLLMNSPWHGGGLTAPRLECQCDPSKDVIGPRLVLSGFPGSFAPQVSCVLEGERVAVPTDAARAALAIPGRHAAKWWGMPPAASKNRSPGPSRSWELLRKAGISFSRLQRVHNTDVSCSLLHELEVVSVDAHEAELARNELKSTGGGPLAPAVRESKLGAFAYAGQLAMVQALLEAGASVNFQTIGGWTPLMEAVRPSRLRQPRAAAMCALLLRARADPNLRTAAGRTAADVSEEGGPSHMAEAYVKATQEIEREAA